MARIIPSSEEAAFFNLSQARWVVGVLNMLIAVVGKESLVGLILRQTRFEINGFVREEEKNPAAARAACYENN